MDLSSQSVLPPPKFDWAVSFMPRVKVLARKLHDEHLSPNMAAATVMSKEYTNGCNGVIVHMFDFRRVCPLFVRLC